MTIAHIKKLLEPVKTEANAVNLLTLLSGNLYEFTYWVQSVQDMERTIVSEFVNNTISGDIKFLSDNKRILKRVKMDLITELKEILQEHAAALIKHHNDLNQNVGLLGRELTYRREVVRTIAVHILEKGTSPESLKAIYDEVGPKLFQATLNMVEINKWVIECIEHKKNFKPSEKLNVFLKKAKLSLLKSSSKFSFGSVSMKKKMQ